MRVTPSLPGILRRGILQARTDVQPDAPERCRQVGSIQSAPPDPLVPGVAHPEHVR